MIKPFTLNVVPVGCRILKAARMNKYRRTTRKETESRTMLLMQLCFRLPFGALSQVPCCCLRVGTSQARRL